MLFIGVVFCILLIFSAGLRFVTLSIMALVAILVVGTVALFVSDKIDTTTAGHGNPLNDEPHITQPVKHKDKAAEYREAQEAVTRARGKPCDYACKVMIAEGGHPWDHDE